MNNVDIGRYSKKLASLLWDSEPKNDHQTPIWCLGRQYAQNSETPSSQAVSNPAQAAPIIPVTQLRPILEPTQSDSSFEFVNADQRIPALQNQPQEWPKAFLDDFESRLWMTYRAGFAPIRKSEDPKATSAISFAVRMKNIANHEGFTSDTGWGCMIRSGQCILANAILLSRLGRDWTRSSGDMDAAGTVNLFADDPRAPFSIHRFVEHGAAACGTYPGQWFGPSATAQCIDALTNAQSDLGLRVYATDNSPDVYVDQLLAIAKPKRSEAFQPTLLLIGTRLGIEHVTPVYRDALIRTLQMPQSIGIAGGRPSASHYFVGAQGNNIFYLDPHSTRPALPFYEDVAQYSQEHIDSVHTRRLRCLPIEEMDPSMLIAFLLRSEEDWLDWRDRIDTWQGKRLLHVVDATPPAGGVERQGAVDEVSTFDTEDESGLE